MLGRVAAAAARDVEPALLGEVAHESAHVLGQKREAGGRERVGQAGVRVATEIAGGDAREFLDVGTHLVRAERAIDADAERPGVRDGNPEGLERLRVERAARVENGDGNLDRDAASDLLEGLLDGEERGLGVERVEDGFDQQGVAAALDQAERLLAVGVDELHVGDAARAGVVGVAGNRGGAVGRAHRAGDEALAARIRGDEFIADAAGEARGLDVEFRDDGLEVVIGLGNDLGVERVGLDDVGAGFEEAAVDGRDDVGAREDEDVAVALEVLGMLRKALAAEVGFGELELLEGGAHGPVDDDDALLQKRFEGMEGGVGHGFNISTYLDASMDKSGERASGNLD